jgi:hypothetical protein
MLHREHLMDRRDCEWPPLDALAPTPRRLSLHPADPAGPRGPLHRSRRILRRHHLDHHPLIHLWRLGNLARRPAIRRGPHL